METIYNNPWTWAIYGVILYNYLIFSFTKDGYDDTRKKFLIKRYALKRWDNWIWSILFIPIFTKPGNLMYDSEQTLILILIH